MHLFSKLSNVQHFHKQELGLSFELFGSKVYVGGCELPFTGRFAYQNQVF